MIFGPAIMRENQELWIIRDHLRSLEIIEGKLEIIRDSNLSEDRNAVIHDELKAQLQIIECELLIKLFSILVFIFWLLLYLRTTISHSYLY